MRKAVTCGLAQNTHLSYNSILEGKTRGNSPGYGFAHCITQSKFTMSLICSLPQCVQQSQKDRGEALQPNSAHR